MRFLTYRKFLIILFILGLVYIKIISVNIAFQNENNFIIYSLISQHVNLHIKTQYRKSKLWCNGNFIKIDVNKAHGYFYKGEEEITLFLHQGKNICKSEYIDKIEQKINFVDFVVLFLFLGIPIIVFLFNLMISILDKFNLNIKHKYILKVSNSPKIIFIIIIIGILIRIFYLDKYGIRMFQHDWYGHVNLIKYLAQTHTLPSIPNKGWEYPQQPLYYIIGAFIYKIFLTLNFSPIEALRYGVGSFSIVASLFFLIFSAKLLNYLTSSNLVKVVVMLFLAFTPSLVYMGSWINNDVLVMALGPIAVYYIVKSYRMHFKRGFYYALIATTLLFLTKISTASIELLFFILLIVEYMDNKSVKRELFIFSLVGIFVLSWTLWRLYLPLNDEFHMVNSKKFIRQAIESFDINYFLSFNILDLISQGYSYVYGNDNVRHSFLTYQYGTMIFGEYNYAKFVDKSKYLLYVMRAIIIFGLVYVIGLVSYIFHLKRENLLNKLLFLTVVINLILILKFVFTYPSICNTDFRYFADLFVVIGYIFAQGLYYLFDYSRYIRYFINFLITGLTAGELIFFYIII